MQRRRFLKSLGGASTGVSGLALMGTAAGETVEMTKVHVHDWYQNSDTIRTECMNALEHVWQEKINTDGNYPLDVHLEDVLDMNDLESYIQAVDDTDDPILNGWRDYLLDEYSYAEDKAHIWTFLPNVSFDELGQYHGGAHGIAPGKWYGNDLASAVNYIRHPKGCLPGDKRTFVHEIVHTLTDPLVADHKLGAEYVVGINPDCTHTYTSTAMGYNNCGKTHASWLPETYWLSDATVDVVREYLQNRQAPGNLPTCMYDMFTRQPP